MDFSKRDSVQAPLISCPSVRVQLPRNSPLLQHAEPRSLAGSCPPTPFLAFSRLQNFWGAQRVAVRQNVVLADSSASRHLGWRRTFPTKLNSRNPSNNAVFYSHDLVTGGHNRVSDVIFIAFCGHSTHQNGARLRVRGKQPRSGLRWTRACAPARRSSVRAAPRAVTSCLRCSRGANSRRVSGGCERPGCRVSGGCQATRLYPMSLRLLAMADHFDHHGHDEASPWPLLAPERAGWAGGAK